MYQVIDCHLLNLALSCQNQSVIFQILFEKYRYIKFIWTFWKTCPAVNAGIDLGHLALPVIRKP